MNFRNIPYIINLFEQLPLLDISFSVILGLSLMQLIFFLQIMQVIELV